MCKTFCGEFTVYFFLVYMLFISYAKCRVKSIKRVFYFIIIKKNVNLLTCKYSSLQRRYIQLNIEENNGSFPKMF